MPDSINLYYFRDKSGKRHSVWKSDYDADPKGFAKAYPDARMEVINRKTGDRGHVAVGDVAAAGKEGFNLFTVRGYQKEHYQKPSTPSQIAQRVGNDYLSRPKNQMGKAPVQAPKNASPFVKSLYETDNAMQGADYPIDYTSPRAVQQVHQKNEQVKTEASRTAARQNEWTRQNQPILNNGTKGVMKTQGQLEKEIDDSAKKMVGKVFGDEINSRISEGLGNADANATKAMEQYTSGKDDSFLTKALRVGGGQAETMAGIRAYNEASDPDKVLASLSKGMQNLASDPRFAQNIKEESARLGVSEDAYKGILENQLSEELGKRFNQKAIEKYFPKGSLDYWINRAARSNTVTKAVMDAAGTKSQRMLAEQAMAETAEGNNPYYKPSTFENVSADVAGMVTDPIFRGAAGIGGKVAGKIIGSSGKLAAVMANGNVMQRLGLNVGQAVTSGGVTGFVFGSTTNAIQNVSTGEDTSLGGTLKAALHGGMSEAGSFATMGVAGVPLGMLGRSVGLKSITTTPLTKEWFKQGTKKFGLEAAKTWMEGTGMYLGGYVAGKIEGHDQPEFNIIDGTLQSLPTAIGFRIQHLLGGIGKGRMKDADGKNLSWGKSTMLKFNEFLTSDKAKSSHYLMSEDERNQIFNSDAAKEILQNGDNIVSLGRRARNTKVDYEDPYLATDMAMVKNSYDKIMADPTISWDAKAKFSATVMGVMPSSRPMSDHQTFTFEKVGGDKVGYKKYINEYSSTGELLSKISYDTADERGRILYNQAVAREDNRFWNAFSALVNVEKNDYDLQNQFFREKVKNWVYGDGNQEKLLAGMRQYNGSTYFDEYTRYVASRSKMAESTLKSTAEELGMDARDLAKAVNKSPLKRTDAEQNACVTLRKNFEKAAYPENKAHAEQSHLEGKDLAEENNLGTEQPNAPIVVTELNNLSQAEDSLQELFNSNDVFSEEYKRYQSQGLTNPQIYDALIQQSGLTQEQIEPFARYINANARVQGMQQATAEAIEQRVESMAGDWGFHGTMDEQKADGSQMLYVQDSNGRTLIVGSGDVAYDPTTGKAKEGVGDMLVCFDPNTREMAYVKTEETTLFQTQNVEDFKNDERTRLQQINSEPYNQAAAQQAAKDAAKPQPKEGMSSSNSSDMHLAEHPKGGSDLLPTPETDIPTAGKDTNNSSNGNENNSTLTFADGSPVPMVKDSKGRPTPDYANMKPEQAAEVLTQQFGENAEKVVDGQIKKAEKAVKDAEKMKVDYTAEPNDILEQEQKKKVIADAANKQLEHAQAIKKAMTQKKVAETMAKPEGEAVEGANQASSAVAEKFSNAPRLVGNKRTRTLPNSEKIKGHYEIVPAESLTPSHDAMNGYKKSEGFPVDENGRTINDRDYENDKAAQQTTDQMALKYNGQAIDQVPVVSDEGVVYDGNGRTMAGQKAAKDGTDGEYISDLLDNAENFGFTREQIENSGIEHPHLVLVTDERMPYDTATFAKFNRNEKKAQSNTEQAVAKSKTLTSDEIGSIVADVEGNGSLEAFFNNPKAISDLVKTLQNKGIIGQNEVAGLMEGEYLNPQGKELVKNILLGAAFKPETIRMMGIDSAIKTKVVSGIRAVLDNMKLGDYALRDEIDQSIQLLYEARTNKMNVDDLLRSSDFVNGNARDRYSQISQALAQVLENKATLFRDLMREYNEVAKSYNTNEGSLSFYEHLSKEELLKEFVEKSNIINDNNIKLYGEEGLKRSDVSSGNEEHSEEAGGRAGEEGHSAEVEAVKSIFKKYGEELTLSKDDITTLADYISNNYKGVKYAFDSWQSENESRINDPNDPNFVRERSAVRQKEKEFESAVESMLNDMQDGLLGSVRNNAIEAIKIALRQGEVKKIEEKSEPITVTVHGNEHHFSSEEVDVAKKILAEYPEKPISKMQREMMIGYDTAKALAKELGWKNPNEKIKILPKEDNEPSNPNDPMSAMVKAADDFKKEHPMTEEEIMTVDDLDDEAKYTAIDYLNGEDDSEIARICYEQAYNKRKTNTALSKVSDEKESSADPMEGLRNASESYNEGKTQPKPVSPKTIAEKKAAAKKLKEENDKKTQDLMNQFLAAKDEKKNGSGKLYSLPFPVPSWALKWMDRNLSLTDKQKEILPKLLSAIKGSMYARIKEGIYNLEDVIENVRKDFKAFFDALDKDDANKILAEAAYKGRFTDPDTGERIKLSEAAEREKKLSPEHQDKLVGDSKTAEERKQREESFISNLKMIMGGRKVDGIRELRQLAKELGLEGVKDTDLQELAETAVVSRARDIANSKAMSPERKFAEIKKLYANQPSLNMRDSDRIRHQQYSTPAPYAYLADMYVNGNGSKEIKSALEPSAGNGMLTIGLPMDKVHVNDIDEARLMNLHRQGFKTITSQDGTQPFADKDVDVVVTNPPFGSVTPKDYDGYKISSLEGQMAINALDSMKDDGRAAIIIGGKTEYAKNGSLNPKDKAFLGYLYSHYNVEDVINVDGSLYAKQGTTYPTRIILINGRRLDENSFPPVKDKARAETVKDYDELYKRINDDILRSRGLDSSNRRELRGAESESDKRGSINPDEKGVRGRDGGRKREDKGVSSGVSGEPAVSGSNDELGHGRRTNGESDGRLSDGSTGTDTAGTETSKGERGGNISNRPDGGQLHQSGGVGRNDAQRRSDESHRVEEKSFEEKKSEVKRGLSTEKVSYVSKSNNPFTLQSVMPADQQEAVNKNLAKLGDVDQFLVDELGYNDKDDLYKHLAAEQIDSVALAIHQAKQGNGFIIGDMTGIGKGRQAASLIRYAKKQGQIPVYFTKTAGLLSDVYRDLVDIGSPDLRPFVFGSDKEANITDSDGNLVYKLPTDKEKDRVISYINRYGKLPKEYDYILTTYSQVSNGVYEFDDNGNKKERKPKNGFTSSHYKGQKRRDAIEKVIDNGYLILDESHTAGGDSGQGNYFQHIIQKAKSVTFFSATFAKRPDNMPIYALRTAMNQGGLKPSELIDAVKRGGATLQEIMSKTLTESGQMIRRERDMTGVTIDWKSIDDPVVVSEQREQYDNIIGLFNDIINFQKSYVIPYIDSRNEELASIQSSMGLRKGTESLGIKSTPFASKAFNTVQQVLLSLKAKEAARRAIDYLKQDIKPVIALSNTNESQSGEIKENVEVEEPDLSTSLKKGLAGTLRYTTKNSKNKEENGDIKLEDLGSEGVEAYNALMKKIESASTGLALSPIDVIKNELQKAGYKVGELTGRKSEFIYNENGSVTKVKRSNTDKKKLAREFNDGTIDALILNKSASTGISLHASNKFGDQRKRVMIVSQQQLDVNDEVQMRGRIDRTGQVSRGAYEYIVSQIPAEQRLLMMFKAKLKSLDANTTASQKSKFNEMDVADITNKYGDKIVREYAAEHLDIYSKMADPFNWEKDGIDLSQIDPQKLINSKGGRNGEYEPGADASKFLGRMALLKVEEQEKMLSEISDLYANEINRLNEMGENDLVITELPLKAKTVGKEVWKEGSEPNGDNAFADNTYIEKVNMAILKKPMRAEEVKKAQDGLTGGRSWDEYRNEKRASIKQYFDEKIASETERLEQRAQKIAQKAADKYKKEAKKNQEQNQFTDEQIEKNAQFQYDNIYKQEKEKAATAIKNIKTKQEAFERVLDTFNTEDAYVLPSDMNNPNEMSAFGNSYGRLIDIKITDNYSPTASTVSFATLDGRRKITFPVSGKVGSGDGKADIISSIYRLTKQAEGMSDKQLHVLNMDVNNWDRLVSNESRKDGYIITGNLMQALIDTKSQGLGGQLIKYTTDTGDVKTGILMPDRFKPTDASTDAPISAKADDFIQGKVDDLASKDGDVKLTSVSTWRGTTIELRVPKSTKRGGKYFLDDKLRSLVDGNDFSTKGNSMTATISSYENVRSVLKRLSELGVRVKEERKEGTHFRTDNGVQYSKTDSKDVKNSRIIPEDVDKSVSSQIEKKFDDEIASVYGRDLTPEEKSEVGRIANIYRNTPVHDEYSEDKNGNKQNHGGLESAIKTWERATTDFENYYGIERITRAEAEGQDNGLDRGTSALRREVRNAGMGGRAGEIPAEDFQEYQRYLTNLASAKRALAYHNERTRVLEEKYGVKRDEWLSQDTIEKIFKDFNTDKNLQTLFDRIKEQVKNLDVYFGETYEGEKGTKGFYRHSYNDIRINLDELSTFGKTKQDLASTILHEMLHPVTSDIIAMYQEGHTDKLTTSQIEAAKEAVDLFNEIKKTFKDNGWEEPYALTNAREFFAELSNPEWRAALKEIKNGDSWWKRALKSLAKMIGFKTSTSKLDEAEKVLDNLLSNFGKEQFDYASKHSKELFKDMEGNSELDSTARFSNDASIVVKRVNSLSNKLGAKVNMVQSAQEITNKDAREAIEQGKNVTGWYDEKTGEVHLYMPNIHDTYTAEKTIWHETVGHKAMRGLIGDENYSTFLRNVWYDLDKPENARLKELVDEELKYNPLNYENAIEEGIARLVEDGKGEVGFWNNIRNKVADIFRSIGYHIAPNTKDVKYLLWLSKNLQKNPNNPYWKMRAEAVRYKLEHEKYTTIKNGMFADNDGKVKGYSDFTRKDWEEATDMTVHFRTTPAAATEIAIYNRAVGNVKAMAEEAYSDKMNSVLELYKAIDPSIKRAEDVKTSENPYMLENLMSSRAQQAGNAFARVFMEPMTKAYDSVLGSFAGADMDERMRNANLYIVKKSGLERNRALYVRDQIRKLSSNADTKDDAKQLQSDWDDEHRRLKGELDNRRINLKDYFDGLDNFIRKNIDGDYKPGKHDYSGFHEMQGMADVEDIDDAKIQDEVMSAESSIGDSRKVDELWRTINAATDYSLDMEYKGGFMDSEMNQYVKGEMNWYVPMRMFDKKTAEDVYGYIDDYGGRTGYVGPALMKAEGRKSLSSLNILAQIGAMGERSINRAARNGIKQAFMRFVNNNEKAPVGERLVTEVKPWFEKVVVGGDETWEERYPQIPEDASPLEISRAVANFENAMKAKEAKGEAKQGTRRGNINYKFADKAHRPQHIVDVWVNGKKKSYVVNGNPRAAQAINGMLDHEGAHNWFSSTNRWLSQVCTSYNPEFTLRNTIRDYGFATHTLIGKEGAAYTLKFEKHYAALGFAPIFNAAKGIGNGSMKDVKNALLVSLFKQYKNGTLDVTKSKYHKWFKEFMDNGGETGYLQMKSVDAWKKQIETDIKNMHKGKLKKINPVKTVSGFVEDMNQLAENIARFATFCASRESGRNATRAAYDAKEVSSNFNRSGSAEKVGSYKYDEMSGNAQITRNAFRFTSSYLRNYTMFFNASVQSFKGLSRNLKNAPIRTIASMVAEPVALGLMMPLVNQMLYALWDDDEKDRKGVKDPYVELPEYERRNNLCIYVGKGRFVKIPIAIEGRAFYGLGDIAASYSYKKDLKESRSLPLDIANQLSQIVPVGSFMESSATSGDAKSFGVSLGTTFLPSMVSPAIELIGNRDWKGQHIYNDNTYIDNAPAWKKAYSGTSELFLWANKKANAWTNDVDRGNENMKGETWADVMTNPFVWEQLFNSYVGGMGTFATRTGVTIKHALSKDSEVEAKDIPFIRSLLYTPSTQTSLQRTKSKWYNYKNEVETINYNLTQLKHDSKDPVIGLKSAAARFKYLNSPKSQEVNIVNDYDDRIKKLNKVLKVVTDDGTRKNIENQKDRLMQEAVEKLDKID